LILLTVLIGLSAIVSGGTLYSVYYRVIGNGNFYVQVATIDAGGPDGKTSMSGGIFNVFSSYTSIPSAYNTRTGFMYWAYPDQNGNSILYEINLKSASVVSKTSLSAQAVDLSYDYKDNKIYGLLAPRSAAFLEVEGDHHLGTFKRNQLPTLSVSFVAMNPANVSNYTTIATQLPGVSSSFHNGDIAEQSNEYYYSSTGFSLTSISLSGGRATNIGFNCSGGPIAAVFNSKEKGVLAGVTVTGSQETNPRVVLLDLKRQVCSNVNELQGNYVDSAYDASANEVSVLTSKGLFVVNLNTGRNYEVKSVLEYSTQYFTALHYAA